jgi:hypothetical protein
MDKEQAEAALVTETERAEAAERDKEALKARLEKKEQARQKAAASAATKSKPKARPVKKAGCAPDDPLCGIPLD